MAEQYFTHNPTTEHAIKKFDFELRNQEFHFSTDNSVFSKQRVDFGTTVLINSIDYSDLVSGPILDLGCGYGPIGLVLAKQMPKRTVDMVDVNERALELAKRNAQANQISNVNIFSSDVYQNITNNYAAIYTNPPIRAGKKVVNSILAGAYEYLLPNGQLWVVVQKKQGESSCKKLMNQTFGNVEIVERSKGYYILKSVKTEN